MAIRLLPNGTFEFDDVSEALAFRDAAARKGTKESPVEEKAATGTRQSDRNGKVDLAEVFSTIHGHSRSLLKAICESDNGVSTGQLAEQTNLQPPQVGPVMRHLTVALRSALNGSTDQVWKQERAIKKVAPGVTKLVTSYLPTQAAIDAWRKVPQVG